MSLFKKRNLILCILLLICSFFAFGCEDKIKVDNIYFADDEIILLVGETYTPRVVVNPSYATNSKYTILCNTTGVLTVSNNNITAIGEGSAIIKVVASDNSLKEDIITVHVRKSKTELASPKNLTYNQTTGVISFDSVQNASSYTLNIDGNDINIGNSLSYNLSQYSIEHGSHYDKLLKVAVRANASTYSQAYITSEFSSYYRIYQVNQVENLQINGGYFTFNKNNLVKNYGIFINDAFWKEVEHSALGYSLNALDEKYFGQNIDIKVVAIANTELYITDPNYAAINFYNSTAATIKCYILSLPTIEMTGSIIQWKNVINASKYEIYLDNIMIDETTNNYYDIMSYSEYETLTYLSGSARELTIKALISSNSKNTASNSKTSNIIKFNKLDTPILAAENNNFVWNQVEYAESYLINLKRDNQTIINSTIELTTYNINNYESGKSYSLKIQAVGNSYTLGGDIVYLLNSASTEIVVTKQAAVELSISDYILSWNALSEDNYNIKFYINNNDEIDLNISGNIGQIDLSTYDFLAGQRTIFVKHLGNGSDYFDSNFKSISFLQLEEIDEISVINSTATIEISSINNSADVRMNFTNGVTSFDISEISYTFNTSDSQKSDYLVAGAYTLNVFVEGDGSTTFSANRVGKTAQPTASHSFEVLASIVMKLNDKENQTVYFNEILNSESYEIYLVKETGGIELINDIIITNFQFGLSVGSIEFIAKTKGDGINTIDSDFSETIKISKLERPTIVYNNINRSLILTDNNLYGVANYNLKLNSVTNSYDFVTKAEFTDFVVGNNHFEIKAIAIDNEGNHYYLNSEIFELDINMIDKASVIMVDENNRLVITPNNQPDEEYLITIEIKTSSNNTTLTIDAGILTDGNYSLPYSYSDGKYYVELLNNSYLPYIDWMTENFTVSIMFNKISTGEDNTTNSGFTAPVNVAISTKTSIAREDQYLTFTNISETRIYKDYALLINGEFYLELDSETITDSEHQVFKIPVSYIFKNFEMIQDSICNIAVITRNSDTTASHSTLSVTGDIAYIVLAEKPIVEITKSNTNSNNSVTIKIAVQTTVYNKEFILELYNKVGINKINIKTLRFTESDAASGYITLYLDDYNLVGKIYISAYILTSDSYQNDSKTIYVFNSNYTDEKNYTKIDSVTGIYVNNGIIYWQAIENAAGYEIYKVAALGNEKINTNLITNNYYNLSTQSESFKIVIKSIAIDNANYTNAVYGDVISLNKLVTPTLNVNGGDLVLTASTVVINTLNNNSANAYIKINNQVDDLYFNINDKGVTVVGNKITIEAEYILNYGTVSILTEKLTVSIVVDYKVDNAGELTYYLDSNTDTISVQGLFKVKNVNRYYTDISGENEIIEHIEWENDSKNIISSESVVYGYLVRFDINNTTYYSNDLRLLYADNNASNGFSNYPSVLMDTNIIFPAGYDTNNNGKIDAAERFGVGEYKIYIKTLAKTIAGYNLLNSAYSIEYKVTLMSSPNLTIRDGIIAWNDDKDATSYLIRIFSKDSDYENEIEKEIVTVSYLDFSNERFREYIGFYGFTVQALSTNENVLNSIESKMLTVYKLPEVEAVSIDDGNLVILADLYFSRAEIKFIDTETQRSETLFFDRISDSEIATAQLGIQIWEELGDESILNSQKKYIITIEDSNILNILSGRSYKINIKLIGNSNTNLAIASSSLSYEASNITAIKLNTNLIFVETGVLQFTQATSYENLNYNFNNATNIFNNLVYWNDVVLYKISITTGSNVHDIYTVDYYSLSNLTKNIDYFILSDFFSESISGIYAVVLYPYQDGNETKYLVFNVFKDNKIDLKSYDNLYYYPLTVEENDDEYTYSSGDITLSAVISGNISYSTIHMADGGSFVIKVATLGGESVTNAGKLSGYLNSNVVTSKTFIRYSLNTLSSDDGKITLTDQRKYDENKQLMDAPVYHLTFNAINSTAYQNVYLYYFTEEEARRVFNDPDGIYVKIKFDIKGNIVYELNIALTENVYTYEATVRTLAGLGVGESDAADYYLNSKVPVSYSTYRLITSNSAKTNAGVIEWDLAYIQGELSNRIYMYDYEIVLTDITNGYEYTYTVNRYSEGITVNTATNKIIYNLPDSIEVDGKIIKIINANNYAIKLRGLATDNKFVLNANFLKEGGQDKILTFTTSSGVVSAGENAVRIEDGELRWYVNDLTNYTQVTILITYKDSNNETATIRFRIDGTKIVKDGVYLYHSYSFGDSKYPIEGSGTSEYIDFGKIYAIKISVVGTTSEYISIINSANSNEIQVTRLKKPDGSLIMTQNGILMFEAIDGSQYYKINISSAYNSYEFITTENILDLNNLEDLHGNKLVAGEYKISIKAIGSDRISSIISNESATITKLMPVQNIRIGGTGNYITWDKVLGADGYKLIFKFMGVEIEQIVEGSDTNYAFGPDEMTGIFSIDIYAISTGKGYALTSDVAIFESSTERPQPIDTITYDESKNLYIITVSQEFMASDNVVISYNLRPYINSSGSIVLSSSSRYVSEIVSTSEIINGTRYYYYSPKEMGYYTDIVAQVSRAGSIYSASVQVDNLHLRLFSYGAGESTNPYRISNVNELLNINLFTEAYYEITSSIDISGVNINELLAERNAIIASQFSGYINGNNYAIRGFNTINLNGATDFALFANVTNATIENLSIGTYDSEINIINTFNSSSNAQINMAILATNAINSTISNVMVSNVKFTINLASGSLSGSVYLAGVVAKSENSIFLGCYVDFEVVKNARFTATSYIGALVAYANAGIIDSSEIFDTQTELKVSQSIATSTFSYIGGVVGYIIGETTRDTGVYNAKTILDISNVYVTQLGGIAGFARLSTIDGCETTGHIAHAGINFSTSIGGLVGINQSSTIINSGTRVVFDISIINPSNVYIGAIAGRHLASSEADINASRIDNCYMSYDFITVTSISSGTITSLGICGSYSGINVTISNCYRIY